MRAATRLASALMLALMVSAGHGTSAAAALDDAVRSLQSGRLRFTFPARDGVSGDGHHVSIRSGSSTIWRSSRSGTNWCDPCDLEVTLTVRDAEVRRLRWRVGVLDERSDDDIRDVGHVDAIQARDYLLTLVQEAEARVAEDALEAAVLSAASVPWRQLLDLARDRERTNDLRRTALFWLGQEAQDAVTRELEGFVADDLEDREVRKSAIFALSQRPEDESIPTLKRVARDNRDPELRRSALFWLAQIDSPEVVDFFEDILTDVESR